MKINFLKFSLLSFGNRLNLLSMNNKSVIIWSEMGMSSKKIFDDSDPKTTQIKKELTDLPDKKLYPEYYQEEYGWVYAKKPHKYLCKAGKAYIWCSCGRSHTQPFCDGTHKNTHLQIKLKPIRWDCTETKEYWFCNCKQTRHRPFCDGTHKSKSVESAQSTIRDIHSPPTTPEPNYKS